MGTLRHLILFGSFGVVGLGLALGIGLSSSPPLECAPECTPQQTIPAVAPAEQRQGGQLEAERARAASNQTAQAPTNPVQPEVTWPLAPVVVEPSPAHAYQVVPDSDTLRRLQAAMENRKPEPVQPGAGESSQPPAPPGGAAVEPGPAAPAAVNQPEVGSPRPAQAARTAGEPTVKGEGDGQLAINIQDTDIRKVLELLSEQGNLNILASNKVQGKVSATLNGVDLDSALTAILKSTGFVSRRDGKFIFVGTPEDFNLMEHSMDQIGTRVYHPNYVKASDLKDLITPLLTEKVGVVSVTAPAEKGIATDDTQVGGDNYAGNEAVLVRDYEAVLTQVDQVVEEIDVRPMQVHIEAMILAVKLGDSFEFGVDFKQFINNGDFVSGWGYPVDKLADIKFDDGALKFGFINGNIGTFLKALEHVGDTNVIATPRLMVLNKHRADILIGRQEGYVSTTAQTETATTQSVQFLDLGTQLRLRPFISPDGLIRMEVHPELSDGSVEVKEGFTLPNKDVTEVTTNIMVRDGCTVVIGGLMQEQLSTTTDQIPFFGNLPLVGVVFRTKKEEVTRHEIIVLITPRIVYEPDTCEEGEECAAEFHRRQEVYREKMSPVGKRSVGRRYLRMAQRAWAAGDGRRALRFAEMAVHFDPLNRAAIDLRSDIWLGNPTGEHTLNAPMDAAPVTASINPLDGDEITPWVLDDLQRSAPQRPLHPLDPGQPGVHRDIEQPRKVK